MVCYRWTMRYPRHDGKGSTKVEKREAAVRGDRSATGGPKRVCVSLKI